MRFLYRLFVLLLIFLLARSLLRTLFAGMRSAVSRPATTPAGQLKKDPVCGTYVPAATSLHEKVKGELVYFCSPECRKKFLAT